MRALVFFLILICSSKISFAQKARYVLIFPNKQRIDSVNINYINPSSIESVFVDKQKREILYYTKRPIIFLSLDSIYKLHSKLKADTHNLIYIVHDRIISDKTEVKIDASYYVYIKEWRLSEASYLDDKFKDMIIVNITLSSTEVKPRIVLRGKADSISLKNE